MLATLRPTAHVRERVLIPRPGHRARQRKSVRGRHGLLGGHRRRRCESVDLKNDPVKSAKIRNRAVAHGRDRRRRRRQHQDPRHCDRQRRHRHRRHQLANVFNESLTASDLATDSVMATEIADNSIDSGRSPAIAARLRPRRILGRRQRAPGRGGRRRRPRQQRRQRREGGRQLADHGRHRRRRRQRRRNQRSDGLRPEWPLQAARCIGRRRDGGRGGRLLDQGPLQDGI